MCNLVIPVSIKSIQYHRRKCQKKLGESGEINLKAPLRSTYWTLNSDIFEELARHMIFSDSTNVDFLSGLSYSCSSLLKYNLPYITKKVGL